MALRLTRPTGSARPVRRAAALTAAAVLTLGVAACSDDDSDSDDTADDTTVEQTDDADDTESDDTDDTEADGAGEESDELSADKTDGLSDGDTITVNLTDLDTDQGYYLGICGAEGEAGGPPTCTGARDDSAWITAEGEEGATDHFDAEGNAEVELSAKATSEDGALDCTTDDCVLKLFGDHKSGFGDVAEIPVTFEG